jgi:hypothetical protein
LVSNQNAAVPVIKHQSQLLPDINAKKEAAFNPTSFETKNFFEIDERAEQLASGEGINIDSTLFEPRRSLTL